MFYYLTEILLCELDGFTNKFTFMEISQKQFLFVSCQCCEQFCSNDLELKIKHMTIQRFFDNNNNLNNNRTTEYIDSKRE